MKLYEYETKNLFSNYGIPIPKGELAATIQQVRDVQAKLAVGAAIKAQVLVRGRGKAGGILFVNTPDDAEDAAKKLLGMKVNGLSVEKVLVEEQISIKREIYFGITVDRINRCYVVLASEIGGVEIERIAEEQPRIILKHLVDPQLGFRSFHARQIAKKLGYNGDRLLQIVDILTKFYRLSEDNDAELAEMNPIAETQDGKFVAVDARLILDDNALFRHETFNQKRFKEQRGLSTREFEALLNGIEYVELDGDIGILGNGAGLVMATLDMINFYGGKPANFLDIGGGAPPKRIEIAFKIIMSNPKVKVLLVNIVGGITLCDEVARGIIQGLQHLDTLKPLLVRLIGANEAEGKRLLAEANIPYFETLEDAAIKTVEHAQKEL